MIHMLLIGVAWVLLLGVALFALVLIAGAWGSLTFRELPLFSAGEEPTTVRVLPMPYDQANHSWVGDGSGHYHEDEPC